MKRNIIICLAALLIVLPALNVPATAADDSGKPYQTIKLWPEGTPDSNGLSDEEVWLNSDSIGNISDPEMWVYKAAKPNGLAVIMCPGGAYQYVCVGHEGTDFADWFNSLGVTYIILKYRMPNGHCDIPLEDAHKAIEIVRAHAEEWGISKVGIMGGSAGGHLASSAATHYTKETRPDFQILLYPVITFQHRVRKGFNNMLFGKEFTDEKVLYYSNELQVTPDCPPAFIAHSADDPLVPIADSMEYYKALIANKVPSALFIYPEGGHGWGFNDNFKYKRQWSAELEKWLQNFVEYK